MSEPLRVGVIGLGYWGPNLVRNLVEIEDAHVTAVCDKRVDRLDLIARRYPGIRTYSDASELIASDDIDAVVIATSVGTHFALAAAALGAGKHVCVEKPLASSTGEAVELIRIAREHALVLMPGHTFLYSPPVVAIHDLVTAGELGEIFFISTSRVNLGLHQPDVSVAWDLGPHDFSILRYWMGATPEYVSAVSRGFVVPSIPDVAFIDLEFESGTIAHVELSWLAPSKLRRTTIVGSKKMVVYDDLSKEPVRIYDSGVELRDPESFGEYRLTYRTGDVVAPRIDGAEPLMLELRDFCAAIRERREPRSSSLVGLEVIRVIEAVDRSLESGGSRVAVGDLFAPRPELTRTDTALSG